MNHETTLSNRDGSKKPGAIERDAEVVMFVHREEYYAALERKKEFAGQAEIMIAKQQNGPIDDVKVRWESDFTRFSTAGPQDFTVDSGPFR